MDDEPRTLPVICLDETACRRLGHLPPPLRPCMLRHCRVSADHPPARLLVHGGGTTPPRTWNRLESLAESLSGATTAILVAFSSWRNPYHLVRAVKTLRASGCELHLVLAESLMESSFLEKHLPDLERDAASIVQVAEGAAMEDRLTGCLEGMAVALSGSYREQLHGRLVWKGSRRHQKPDACLDEVMPNSAIMAAPTFFAARLEDGMATSFVDALGRRGYGGHPVATALRPRGARVGIFHRLQEIDGDA